MTLNMMMKIVEKSILADTSGVKIVRLEVFFPSVAQKIKPGQFVVVMAAQEGERIPLTVVDKDIAKGTIILIVQEAGFTTRLIGKLNPGDSFYALLGPLGQATPIKRYGKVVLVGGGVGIAEIYPVAKALKEAGNQVEIIVGAKERDLLILERELKAASDRFFVATDNGSYGQRGFTTDILKELLLKKDEKYDLVYAVGPIPMMEKVSLITKDIGIKAIVCLNALMVDGTGMCGCCRVSIGGKTKFSCIDGPDFDAHLVDWQELEARNRIYQEKEKHICNLYKSND
ncbi:MAG: sulfide/dihydroorotate dehydrogenase-like FAD/NAD-binding protein [Omnitrophica bacterium]|nr:sulfide/dihydroorotate dehydrogenase-like FAD/NAD-binding protein [Candidatus Omnitrophota bacterium]